MAVQIVNVTSPRNQGLSMPSLNFSGSTEITAEGIKKHFKTIDPLKAVFELVWNGFDARASTVKISLQIDELGTPKALSVSDDGDGIAFRTHRENFGRFNDSSKKDDVAQHGSHGRGRLAFHRLAHTAKWYTKTADGEAIISVSSDSIKDYDTTILDTNKQHGHVLTTTGTAVVLGGLSENLADHSDLLQHLSKEFGWFLALNPTKRLLLNDDVIKIPSHELHEETFFHGNVAFEIRVFRWDDKPSSEKSYTHLLGSPGRVVFRELSTLNNKPNFFTSIYVQSPWADKFAPASSLFEDANTPDSEEWRLLTKHVTSMTRGIYADFLRKFVDREIDRFEREGTFPTYSRLPPEYASWRLQNTKAIVRTIYTADPAVFTSLSKKQRKVLVGLLDRLSVSNENDSLYEILDSVLDLDNESVEALASQLKRTTIENIISTIELLQQRQMAVLQLKELMNVHYADVRETPDLQRIIENNTWLFGPQYEILGAEEATFTKIAKGMRDGLGAIDEIAQSDLEGDASIEGAARQPDLFLARKFPAFDSFGKRYYRCVVVEIKRPSISLNVKHLRQLDDYAAIIKRHPEFSSAHTRVELILVGRKISEADTEIPSRLRQQLSRGETGLVTDDDGMKRYVLNWHTLLDGFELTNAALLDKLKLQRDELSSAPIAELISDLQGIEPIVECEIAD